MAEKCFAVCLTTPRLEEEKFGSAFCIPLRPRRGGCARPTRADGVVRHTLHTTSVRFEKLKAIYEERDSLSKNGAPFQ